MWDTHLQRMTSRENSSMGCIANIVFSITVCVCCCCCFSTYLGSAAVVAIVVLLPLCNWTKSCLRQSCIKSWTKPDSFCFVLLCNDSLVGIFESSVLKWHSLCLRWMLKNLLLYFIYFIDLKEDCSVTVALGKKQNVKAFGWYLATWAFEELCHCPQTSGIFTIKSRPL